MKRQLVCRHTSTESHGARRGGYSKLDECAVSRVSKGKYDAIHPGCDLDEGFVCRGKP
jgi:hypothetical protein